MIDPQVSYEEHRNFLEMVKEGAAAEYVGFVESMMFDEPRPYRDKRFQRRYEQGFFDGKAKRMAQKVAV